jgi:hypothetical protein
MDGSRGAILMSAELSGVEWRRKGREGRKKRRKTLFADK